MQTNQGLIDALNLEVLNSRRLEVINRDLVKQHLRDERELVRKETLIAELKEAIGVFEKEISCVRKHLYSVQKENREKDKHISHCEQLIKGLEEKISQLRERIQQLTNKKFLKNMENLSFLPVHTLIDNINSTFDIFIRHFAYGTEIGAPPLTDLRRAKKFLEEIGKKYRDLEVEAENFQSKIGRNEFDIHQLKNQLNATREEND
jgi:hypothetical protein